MAGHYPTLTPQRKLKSQRQSREDAPRGPARVAKDRLGATLGSARPGECSLGVGLIAGAELVRAERDAGRGCGRDLPSRLGAQSVVHGHADDARRAVCLDRAGGDEAYLAHPALAECGLHGERVGGALRPVAREQHVRLRGAVGLVVDDHPVFPVPVEEIDRSVQDHTVQERPDGDLAMHGLPVGGSGSRSCAHGLRSPARGCELGSLGGDVRAPEIAGRGCSHKFDRAGIVQVAQLQRLVHCRPQRQSSGSAGRSAGPAYAHLLIDVLEAARACDGRGQPGALKDTLPARRPGAACLGQVAVGRSAVAVVHPRRHLRGQHKQAAVLALVHE